MARLKTRKLSKKEAKYLKKRRDLEPAIVETPVIEIAPKPRTIEIPQVVTIRNFAELSAIPVTKIIEALLKNGIKATINESIDFDTAAIISSDFNLELKPADTTARSVALQSTKNLKSRPPIVAVMGHVDHGKTKLLDAIRQTNLAEKESGGITQHIGAYQVEVKAKKDKRKITFLDTPGHEAFSSLRAHGANITDIVVLVVAADDGVKQQTIEALSHARAAQVPIIVAINKIDLPQADPQKVRRQLAQINLLPEDWGGKIPVVEVSAKQKLGLDHLLEIIILTAGLHPAMSDAKGKVAGAIVEAHIDPGTGPTATALVMQGELKIGDIITAGRSWGKIRSLKDWQGGHLKQAWPGMPVVITGLKSLPEFGDTFHQVDSEDQARTKATEYAKPSIVKKVSGQLAEGQKALNIVLKADASASLEALGAALSELRSGNVTIKIITSGIGPVSETDVKHAAATKSQILAFRVPVASEITRLAQQQKVPVNRFDVIYQLVDEAKTMLKELIEPKLLKKQTGRLTIVKIFMQSGDIALVGGKVSQGVLKVTDYCMIERDDNLVGEGKITSIQTGETSLAEAKKGTECGLKISKTAQPTFKIKEGDKIVAYVIERVLEND